jgi:hypothetical protein
MYSNLTLSITPSSRDLLEKLTVAQLVMKFPAFYGTWRFIAMSQVPDKGAHPKPDESNPHPHTLRLSNVVLPSIPKSSKWFSLQVF